MKKIAILGSTGSIGTQALDLCRRHPDRYRVTALTARGSREKLFAQVREFRPEMAGLTEGIDSSEIPEDLKFCRWMNGQEALHAAAAEVDADQVLVSIVGIAGLRSVLDALGAGPSSSGKTTSSKRLSIELLTHGISPIPIEMDNFFLDRVLTPRDENGDYDFETVHALNIPLFRDCIRRLINGETVQIPRFDFVTGKSLPGQVLQMKENQILIVEGIHGLNPLMQENLDPENIYRIFVAPMTQINMDRYNRVSTLDVRLLRRIVRDFRDRGYSAAATIARWESVRAGERKYINPYQNLADMLINTALVYEVSALKNLADIALRMVPFNTPEYVEAKRLLAFLEWVRPLDLSLVPANSILSEFVGGSNLKDFITWKG